MLSLILIIVILTVLISYQGFSNPDFKEKSLFVPYQVKYQKEYYRIFSHIFIYNNKTEQNICKCTVIEMISKYILNSVIDIDTDESEKNVDIRRIHLHFVYFL